MNSFLDEFLGRDFTEFLPDNWFAGRPSVNISEEDAAFKIEFAAPGLERDDFSIELKDDTLLVKVDTQSEAEEKEENYLRREFNYTTFQRQFHMPENVNAENISAKYENGILVLTLPKEEHKDPSVKRIEIA